VKSPPFQDADGAIPYRQDATRSCPGGGEAVDVVTEPGLKARIRQRVLAEAVAV
jgi:hypothetical protein